MSFAVMLALMAVMTSVAYSRLVRIEQLTTKIEKDILPGLSVSREIKIDQVINYAQTEEYALQSDAGVKQTLGDKARSDVLDCTGPRPPGSPGHASRDPDAPVS